MSALGRERILAGSQQADLRYHRHQRTPLTSAGGGHRTMAISLTVRIQLTDEGGDPSEMVSTGICLGDAHGLTTETALFAERRCLAHTINAATT